MRHHTTSCGIGTAARRRCTTPIACHGHSRQAHRTRVTLAERLCRTVDRINPPRMCGSYRGLGRGTFAPNLTSLRSLLQQYQNAPDTGQRCAGLSLCSADRNHHVIRDPRWTSSPLRPGLGFRYTQGRAKRVCSWRPRVFQSLPRTQPDECSKCRRKLCTELVVFRDVLNPLDQCDIFGTHGFFQCFNFLEQFIDLFAVFVLVGLHQLLSEFVYIAIGLGFDFVAADDCHGLLCVTLAYPRVLSMCVHRHGGDHQNSNNELSVHQNVPSIARVCRAGNYAAKSLQIAIDSPSTTSKSIGLISGSPDISIFMRAPCSSSITAFDLSVRSGTFALP